ncbi:MAG: hypothetical protein JW863_00070 [Chitinispirillaceae bacterium]|nr:hypothetical protein [Chitinispirillaceae bacterium]
MNFEANRKKILEELQRNKSRKKVHHAKSATDFTGASTSQKIPVVVFGQKSPFLINLLHSLGSRCEPTPMTDVDTAVDFIMEKSIPHLIIDIDPPSDYHLGVNLLTVVKSVSSSLNIFVCTKDIHSQQAHSLEKHGCTLLEKPLSIPTLMTYLT